MSGRARLGPFTGVGATVAVLAAVSYVAGWRLGWVELMALAGGCLVALGLAVPFVVGRLALDLHRVVDPERVMAGEPAGAVLTVRNPARRRTRAVVIDERIGDAVAPIAVPALAPGAEHSVVYRLPTERRACVPVGPAEVARTDPLGLLRRRVSQAPATTLWVHPRSARVEPLPSGFAKDLEGPTSDASPAGDIAFHALRPYQLGDDRRHIHWLSTARSGTLMVRHYVDNRRPTVGVLLDDATTPYDDDMFEVAIEVTASLLVSAATDRLPVIGRTRRAWLAGRMRPAGPEAVLDALTLLARSDQGPTLVEAAADLVRVETATSAVVLVTGGRSAPDLLATVAHLRRRVRVIVVVVDGSVSPEQRVDRLPGAVVLHAADLPGFRAAWSTLTGRRATVGVGSTP